MNDLEKAVLLVNAADANLQKLKAIIAEDNISKYTGDYTEHKSVNRVKENIRQIRQDLQDVSRMLEVLAK